MKRLLLLLFILGFFTAQAQQKRSITPIPNMVADANYRVGCSLFTDPNNYTTGSSFSYNAPVNNNSYLVGPGGANYGCLYSVPNQAWFIITVNTGGNLYFNFANTYGYDVDAAIWGPIADNNMANACAATQNTPLTCDYDTGRPDLYINNAQAGQKYVMLVTNYSNANTIINISQPTGGSVTYAMVNLPNCSMIPTATISGTSTTITEGQSATLNLSFTGSSPWNYTLSDGTIGTTYTSPISINVYPTASQTYTISSVSNICGTNSGSGSVGISVVRNISMKSCFPLDGNATDSKGVNPGTLQNGVAATINRNSETNKALQFNGVNDYVSITTNQLNNNTFTLAAWVKLDELPTSVNTEKIALSLGGTGDEHYLGVEYYNGAPSWKFSSNNSKVYATSIVDTDWHLLIGVRTGGLLKFYVDGILTGTTSVSGAATYSSPLNGRIGSGIADNKFFKGKIDDIKIFNSSLIDPEILLLQNYTNCNDVFSDTYISVQSISTALICTNTPFTVRAFTNNLTIENDTPFVVELSDENGSFGNPTIIGSSNFLPLTANIPNTVAGGSHKIRIRYGASISINTFDIYVNKLASYNITGTTTISDGQSANVTLNFAGTGPWNYVLSTGLSGAATTSPWIIPVTPDQTTTYSVISAQNVCGNVSADGNTSATVAVNFTKQNVTCLPFNGNANDEKANNATTVNGPLLTENRYGQTNAAYAFDGANNYIEYTTNLLRKREYTMSAWVIANTISGGTQYILSQGETGTNTFQGLALTNGGWQFISYTNGGAYTASSTTSWAANQWVHLTAVRTYQQLKLYVNGNLVATTYNSDNIPFKVSDIGRVGANSSSLGNYFNGKIDDIRLYKGALNDEEVYALYANTGSCPTVENASIILVKSLSPTTVCAGNTISVSYTSSNVSPTAGSPLKVQLSNQNGSFANPIDIGTGISSPITATIPVNSSSSSLYKVRIVSSGGSPVTSLTTATLNVSGTLPSATISGGGNIAYGESANLTITFTGNSPWTYAINNGSSQTSSTNPLIIPVSPTSTTTYTVTSISNTCGAGTGSGSAIVTVAPNIILGNIASTFCQGQTFTVPFTANYTPNPNFKVELSDATGSFASPTTIGTGTNSPVSVTIPNSTPAGSAYKIRIVTTSPAYTSSEFINLTVLLKPTATISGTASIKKDKSTNLTITFTGNAPWTYSINNGNSQTTSTNPLTVSVSPVTTTTYTVTSVSNSCGSGTTSGSAIVTVSNDPYLVSCYLFNGNANDGHGDNHGVMGAGASFTTDRFNNPNSALYLNGNASNSYVDIALDELINTSAYTFAVWYNTEVNATTEGQNIFAVMPEYSPDSPMNSHGKSQSIHLLNYYTDVRTPAALYYGTVCTNNTQCRYPFGSDNDIVALNTWYHVVVTRENNVVKLYRNGVLLNTISVIATNSNLGNLKGYIGREFYELGISRAFKGKIDDLKIYRRALNNTQIEALYSQTNCIDVTEIPSVNIESTSSNTICRGDAFTIQYKSKDATKPIKVQLSDANGSFTSPLQIGSGSESPLTAQIPVNQAIGSGYKIRLVSSDNTPLISSAQAISVAGISTATISGSRSINPGESAKLTISFTGVGPWNYSINNGVSQTANSSPVTVTVTPTTTTTYTVTSVSNLCGSGTTSGSAVITVTNNPYLISCYPFNGNANDSQGDNHGVKGAGATFTTNRFNTPNSALFLNGNSTNSFVDIPLDELTNTSAYSISLWFSVPAHDSYMYGKSIFVLMPQDYNPQNPAQSYDKAEYLNVRTNFDEEISTVSYNWYISNGFTVNINTWYHLVLTRENNVVKLYQNGVLVNTYTLTTGNPNFGNLGGYIGRGYGYGGDVPFGDAFKGKIDDIQIYRKALSAFQVTNLYSQTSCGDIANQPLLSLGTVSNTTICKTGDRNVSVSYSSSNVTSPIKVQLSDANGSFATPTEIGSGNTSPIAAQIPVNQPDGSGYKIRLVSSDGTPAISNLSQTISINSPATATISGVTTIDVGQSANLTINFTGTAPWTYKINNGTSQTTSTNPLIVAVSPTTTTTYTITSISNGCGAGSASGSAVITVNPHIAIGSLSSSSFCQGQTISIPFTTNFTPTPNYRVELSDSTGSFTNPTILGTGTSSPISVTIPANMAKGTAYKIRIVTDSPAYTSPTVNNLTVKEMPTASISGTAAIDEGRATHLTVNFTGIGPWTYKVNNGTTLTSNANTADLLVSPLITTTYTVTSLSNACGNGISTGSATLTVTYLPVRLVSCFPFDGNTNDAREINHALNYGAALTTDRFGNANKAYNFENGYVADLNSIHTSHPEISISLWFNSSISQPFNTVYAILNLSDNVLGLKRKNDGKYYIQWTGYSNFGQDFYEVNLPNYVPEQWYSLVFIHAYEKIYIYINNVLIGNFATLPGYEVASHFWQPHIYIGSNYGSYKFIGKIDDVQFYKGALTAGQVQALYNNSLQSSSQACYDASKYVCLSTATYSSVLSGENTFKTKNQIIGSGAIQTGANIYFDAKNSVILQPGFTTEGNAVFKATVGGGCID
jgi:hypothetical protein